MRKITITQVVNAAAVARATEDGEYAATDRASAEALAPWAAEVVEVDGGWIAFEDSATATAWAAQG